MNSTAKTTTEDLTKEAAPIVEKVTEVAQDAVEKTKAYASDLAKQVESAVGEVPDLIKRYPVQSLLVGFGIGFGAAFLFNKVLFGKSDQVSI